MFINKLTTGSLFMILIMLMIIISIMLPLCQSAPSLILKTGGKKKSSDMILFPNHSKCGSPTLVKSGGGRKGKNTIILGHEEECKETKHIPYYYPMHVPEYHDEHKQHYDHVSVMPVYHQASYGHTSYGGGGGHSYGGGDYHGGGGGYEMMHSEPSGGYDMMGGHYGGYPMMMNMGHMMGGFYGGHGGYFAKRK